MIVILNIYDNKTYIGGILVRKILSKAYDIIFSEVFFLSSIFIAFVINSFFSTDTRNVVAPIAFLIKNRVYSVTIIVFWAIIAFIKNNADEKQIKITALEEEIKKKERQIEQSSGLLEARYGEFADMISINNIEKIFKNTVTRFPLVESCHLYSYEFHRIDNCVDIKVNFLQGYEQERVCINVIKQNYYRIEKSIFQQLVYLKDNLQLINEQSLVNKVLDLYNMVEASHSHESIKYTLKEILFYMLCEKSGYNDKGIERTTGKKELDSFRTGIIGSVLLGKGYVYRYKRDKEDKIGRVYFSTPIILNSEYTLTIAIDGRDLSREELFIRFENIVLFIKQEYNKLIGGVKHGE